jgi:hypothetical protein
MPCTREPVRMSGTLSANGLTAFCTVSAMRVTLSGTRLFKNCLYSIDWVAKPLPEGNYKLSVEGKTIDMRYDKRVWQETKVSIGEGLTQATSGVVKADGSLAKGLRISDSGISETSAGHLSPQLCEAPE